MKNYTILILTLIFLYCNTFSQNGWIKLNHGIYSQQFNSVCFVNENTGFVAGTIGVIKTTDSGQTWLLVYDNYLGMILNSVHSINGIDILVAGYGGPLNPRGVVIWSDDGGYFWTFRFTGSIFTSFYTARYLNDLTAFVLGANGQAYRTTNNGISWNSLNLNIGSALYDIEFADSLNGFISGGGTYKTTNGGANWVYNIGTGGVLSMINSNHLYQYTSFGHQAGLKKTTNGGITWNSVVSNIMPNLSDLLFINLSTGYAVGNTQNNNVLMKTTNAGLNWNTQIDSNGWLHSLCFVNELTGYAVGNFDGGVIFKTTNGGNPIGVETIGHEIPNSFSLSQNYPNPFNPSTKIRFD